MGYKEIIGNLIYLAQDSQFDVIAHGCNCFCTMKSGIAPDMHMAFGCNEPSLFPSESEELKGEINKLGTIEFNEIDPAWFYNESLQQTITVVNAYTQYHNTQTNPLGKDAPNVDYEAIRLCMRKMNHIFKGKHIGLPQIGAGKAKGSWNIIKEIIQDELKDCEVTIVIWDKK